MKLYSLAFQLLSVSPNQAAYYVHPHSVKLKYWHKRVSGYHQWLRSLSCMSSCLISNVYIFSCWSCHLWHTPEIMSTKHHQLRCANQTQFLVTGIIHSHLKWHHPQIFRMQNFFVLCPCCSEWHKQNNVVSILLNAKPFCWFHQTIKCKDDIR